MDDTAPTTGNQMQPEVASSAAPTLQIANETAPTAIESPRITLADLYGPSTPAQQPVEQPQQAVPTETLPVMPIPTQKVAQPVVAEPRAPMPESTVGEPIALSQSVMSVQESSNEQTVFQEKQPVSNGGGGSGFPISSIIKFAVFGAGISILLLLVWFVGSLLFAPKQGSGKVELTYWGLWEDSNVMQTVLADFQKQNPNITVTYSKQDPKDYTKRLLTRVKDGNGPDVFRFHNTWVYPLQSLLLPLPSQVVDKKQLDSVYPGIIGKDLVVNGAVYGLPLQMDTLSLFINKDIFSHAGATVPTTWDNFIIVAKGLTVKDPNGHIQTAGAAIGTYENISHAPDIMSLLLLQNGADLKKLAGSQNAIDAFTFYSSFARPDTGVWDSTLDNSLLAFAKGKAAMYFGYSYDIFAIKAINPSLNFGINPVPRLSGRNITMGSYWVEGISNKSKHQKEAIQLLQYLSQKDIQSRLYTEEAKTRAFGELYARLDLAEGIKANPLLSPFVTQYKDAQSSFFSGDTSYDEYNGALNRYLGNAINSMNKDTSVQSALTTLQQGVDQVISLYAGKSQ